MRRSLLIDIATSSRLDLTPEELAEVERMFKTLADGDRRTRRSIIVSVGTGLLGAVVAQSIAIGLREWIPVGPPWSTVGTIVIAFVAPMTLVGVVLLVFFRAMRRHVRGALRACGHDVCEGCGYRLEGVPPRHACPECGRREQGDLGGSPAGSSL